jgi:murein DD-endopeptidase MepM/ murein hydrolase activator NlpD
MRRVNGLAGLMAPMPAFTVMLCASFVMMPHAALADSIAQQQAKIEATHVRIRQRREQLQFEDRRAADIQRQLRETTTVLSGVQHQFEALQAQIDVKRTQQSREQQVLVQAQDALRRQRVAFRHRIVQMYEARNDDRLAVLLGTTSFVDFTERWDDLRFVAAADEQLVRARDSTARAVDDAERTLASTIVQLRSEEDASAQTRGQLGALAQERGNLLAISTTDRTHVAAEVQELEDISAQEEAQLEALVRAKEAAAERERAGSGVLAVPPPAAGAMQWPLTGPITSPFGMRLNPFGGGNTEFHPGIDIAVAVGATVAAAAAGRVIIVGWVSGYGNYIAIDHGGGISTGYGHLSEFYVSVGQNVVRGQAIGASGNTGRSTGPHLIFEVRRNGTPVDPNPFL